MNEGRLVDVPCTGCGGSVGTLAYADPGMGAVFRPSDDLRLRRQGQYEPRPADQRPSPKARSPITPRPPVVVTHHCGAKFSVNWSNRGRPSG